MVNKLDQLIIPRSTVESISQQEIGQLMVGFAWRVNIRRKPFKLIQVGLLQIVGAAIVFTAMMLPVDRVLNTYRSSSSQSARLTQLIWVDGMITIMISSGLNWWIFCKGKRLPRLLKLVDQIEQYNQIVNSIAILEQVANLTNNQSQSAQSASMIELLNQTRQNLLTALQIDRYLRQYPNAAELTISIAHNLINLQNLAQQPQLAEYGTLLTQAWEIGMSVYIEAGLSE
jgi:hypothetical protein